MALGTIGIDQIRHYPGIWELHIRQQEIAKLQTKIGMQGNFTSNGNLAAQTQQDMLHIAGLDAWLPKKRALLQFHADTVFGTDRDAPANRFNSKGKENMIRDYLSRHKDIIFTLVMALLVDHFVLGGALRQRIQRVVEAALERTEKALGLPKTDSKE